MNIDTIRHSAKVKENFTLNITLIFLQSETQIFNLPPSVTISPVMSGVL